MIDLKFEVSNTIPCTTKTFEINGVRAFVTDFCDYIRIRSDSGYGCKSMSLEIDSRNKLKAMIRYYISESDFYAIGTFLISVFDLSDGCDGCE